MNGFEDIFPITFPSPLPGLFSEAAGVQYVQTLNIPWDSILSCDRMLYCDNKFLADDTI